MPARFTRDQLESYRGATVPDLVGRSPALLFVGINPGLWTAATQTHFCHPSNRFYPALRMAGLIDWSIDTSTGMSDEQRLAFVEAGLGITNLVRRATARAAELSAGELKDGAVRLERFVGKFNPNVVAVSGITAYRTAFGRPKAEIGEQPHPIVSSTLWVVPNPSGLNAHETVESLATWFRAAANAAGL